MTQDALKKLDLPDRPGVYRFLDERGDILYIGKATSLRDRVRSYFANDLLHTRGKHIVDMTTIATTVRVTTTDSALEALILEAALIKKHQPPYNTREKDNRSFNYVVVTNEAFPRVLVIRERNMLSGVGDVDGVYRLAFGPFPQGTNLIEALKAVRWIFPFRDRCEPRSGKPCFNRQIGLCPGVCSGEIDESEYEETIKNIKLFFEGKKSEVAKRLTQAMKGHAAKLEFEQAGECKKMLFALSHIKDVALLDEEIRIASQRSSKKRARAYRIEAYDVAHISGTYTVGVMVVVEDGRPKKSDYRKFKIRIAADRSDDTLHLEEVLRRRFGHLDWQRPDLLVIDGGLPQKRRAEKVIKELGIGVDIVSVVKDERHRPKAILGNKELIESYKNGILIGNGESHRFAVAYHRSLRDRIVR